jgi:hypothetical protein
MRHPIRHLAAVLGALATLGPGPALAELDLGLYGALLAEHTETTPAVVGTRVDYRGLAADPRWPRLLAGLEAARPSELTTRAQRLAFWINAYNVLAIRMVIDHYPVESIRDAGSLFRPVWKREIARIEGRGVTLDEIEHEILRKLGEPRIHGAIVCASTSCPSLAREPYSAAALDKQLDASMRRWMASPAKGLRIDRPAGRVTLSRIFSWFASDFEAAGGALAFATRYAPDAARQWLEGRRKVSVSYFDYDWSLNDWRR